MAKRKTKAPAARGSPKGKQPAEKPDKATTLSIYIEGAAVKERVKGALELLRKRMGVPITLSGWLGAIVMKAVQEEERLAGKG